MQIRKTTPNDINTILNIFDTARQFMRSTGNIAQWDKTYPSVDILSQDVQNGNSYVCVENGRVVATFSLIIGDDPTYHLIEHGNWHLDALYGTVHRLASDGTVKGIARTCFDFCKTQISYLRVDTHADNIPMQACFKQNGFKECGTIYVRDGSPRIAYDYIGISE